MLELLREGYDTLFRRHLSLTVISVIFFICLVTALSTGFWLPTRLAYVIFFGIPIAYFWANGNTKKLEVTTERPMDRLQAGQEFTERITVKNLGWFTKLWLEVDDPSDMPGHIASQVISLGPRESRSWRTTTLCRRRGLFRIGPVRITTGDPFGFFRYTNYYGHAQNILVYPQATKLPNFYVPPANLPASLPVPPANLPAGPVTENAPPASPPTSTAQPAGLETLAEPVQTPKTEGSGETAPAASEQPATLPEPANQLPPLPGTTPQGGQQ